MYSPDGRYSNLFISNYLDVYVKDALKRIHGVGDVVIFGERKYAMRIWVDPVRLAARALTATDVSAASCRAERGGAGRAAGPAARTMPSRLSRSR